MNEAGKHWRLLSEGRPIVNAWRATAAELEAEACWMQEGLKVVLDSYAPGRQPHARSKRWWSSEIKLERTRFGRSRRDYNDGRIGFDDYRQARNFYYRYIRRAKRLAWERFLEGVFPTDEESQIAPDPERCWRALRYTKAQVPSYTPAINISGSQGQPDRIAATAEEKEEVFMAQAFPPQAEIQEDIEFPDSSVGVSARKVRKALFAQSFKKAPGVDGIGFKALRLL